MLKLLWQAALSIHPMFVLDNIVELKWKIGAVFVLTKGIFFRVLTLTCRGTL